jgi:subtilase family serine protease
MYSRLVAIAAPLALASLMTAAASASTSIEPGTLGGGRDLGRAPSSALVQIAVVLNYHHDSELDALVEAQGDPDSAVYGHFLSPTQFRNYFSPTAAEYQRVANALVAGGFKITNTFANRTVIDAQASAPVAARFFNTDIHRVMTPDVGMRITNVRAGAVPASIGGLVLGVLGLDTVRHMHPDYAFLPRNAPRPIHSDARFNAAPLFGPDGGYGPQVFINSYGFPSNTNGAGRTVGMVGDADFLDSDVAGFNSEFQVTRTGTTTRVLVDGGPPPGDGDPDSVEAVLDSETLSSLAPGANLYSYEAPSSATLMYFVDMYNQIVTDNKVDSVNTSYSECETAFIPTFPMAADAVEKQGSALGITFHGSTGDSGVITYGCNQKSLGSPSDTPHNIAVGGTIMAVNHSTGFETSEVGWNDNSGATGGGISVVFTKIPGFQKKVTTVLAGGRNTPDISDDASPFTGESFFFDGRWEGPIGGTSLASPIFGASLAQINQLKNRRQGWFNKALYKTWLKNGYGSGSDLFLRDITSGSIPPYSAGPGYDQMTGIGTMQVNNFASILKK